MSISADPPAVESADSDLGCQLVLPRSIPAVLPPAGYGREFWLSYLSNGLLMASVTLLYRYADFIVALGGTELDLGRIVGVGMVGSLVMRFVQGQGIDRLGPRSVWLWSLLLFVLSLLGHLAITRLDTPAVYALRILFSISLAGAFGASITYVSQSMPLTRMAEVIGMLGTSGFISMALGPLLGDMLRHWAADARGGLQAMFLAAAALGSCSLICATLATHGQPRPIARRRPPLVWLLRRYHPGPILWMAVVMGVGFSLPGTFLATFAAERSIAQIADFFIVYALTALVTRVVTRRFPSRFGIRPLIFLGLAAMVVSLLCYLAVSTQRQLVVPGFFAGIAHALLFPAIVASGSATFPNRYRGLGNTVMLAMFDIGTLVGAPLVGGIIELGKSHSWPAYPIMFVTVAAGMTTVGVLYAIASRKEITA